MILQVTVLTTEAEIAEALSDGQIGTIIVEETPFLCNNGWSGSRYRLRFVQIDVEFDVEDTVKILGGKDRTCR